LASINLVPRSAGVQILYIDWKLSVLLWEGGGKDSKEYPGWSVIVPDKRSRVLEVVIVRRIINLGTGNLEWGGNGKGLRKGRSVHE
jgi:hypothetical protein